MRPRRGTPKTPSYAPPRRLSCRTPRAGRPPRRLSRLPSLRGSRPASPAVALRPMRGPRRCPAAVPPASTTFLLLLSRLNCRGLRFDGNRARKRPDSRQNEVLDVRKPPSSQHQAAHRQPNAPPRPPAASKRGDSVAETRGERLFQISDRLPHRERP